MPPTSRDNRTHPPAKTSLCELHAVPVSSKQWLSKLSWVWAWAQLSQPVSICYAIPSGIFRLIRAAGRARRFIFVPPNLDGHELRWLRWWFTFVPPNLLGGSDRFTALSTYKSSSPSSALQILGIRTIFLGKMYSRFSQAFLFFCVCFDLHVWKTPTHKCLSQECL